MWDDYMRSKEIMPGSDTIAVNMAGMVVSDLTHLFSWHHKQISAIKDFRQAEWPDEKAIVHSVKEYGNVQHVWNFDGVTSVSGMTAVELAWLLGYRKIALVGIPQDNSGYFYKHKSMDNPDIYDQHRTREIFKLYELFGQAVKSFSGKTARVLGEPTEEWLNGDNI